MQTKDLKITIIGAGNMGGAIASGLAKGKLLSSKNISVCDKQKSTLEVLKSQYPEIKISSSNLDFLKEADVVLLAVKPHLVELIAEEIRNLLDLDRQILVSIAAGVELAELEKLFWAEDKCLFRVIPNTAVELSEGVSSISSVNATKEQEELVAALFKELGEVFVVPESQLDAMMALASCGIAYAFRYVYASVLGGVELGVSAKQARRAVLQTLRGAIEILEASDKHAEEEIERVTTPGGFTIKGLNEMEAAGFTSAVIKGLKASCRPKIKE